MELLGQSLAMLLQDCPCDPAQYQAAGAGAVHGREGALRHKDGHGLTVLLNANFSDAGTMTGFLTDITGRKQDEARMQRLATHDTLTGLPNRSLLNELLQRMLDCAGGDALAVVFIDLAHALNLSVIAEGIETADTLDTQRAASCDEGQGYLFSKPLSLAEFQLFLARLPAPVPGITAGKI